MLVKMAVSALLCAATLISPVASAPVPTDQSVASADTTSVAPASMPANQSVKPADSTSVTSAPSPSAQTETPETPDNDKSDGDKQTPNSTPEQTKPEQTEPDNKVTPPAPATPAPKQSKPQKEQSQAQTQPLTVKPQDNTCIPSTDNTWSGSNHGGYSTDIIKWDITADCKMTIISGTLNHNYTWSSLPWQGTSQTKITSLDAKHLTLQSGVTTLADWFYGCSSLASLDLSGWNTSLVTNMSSMFQGCSSLTSLKVAGWNTWDVTTFANMFHGCSSLAGLDLTGWNIRDLNYSTASIQDMFTGCAGLAHLTLDEWKTDGSSSQLVRPALQTAPALTTLDISRLDARGATDLGGMLSSLPTLKTITANDWTGYNTSGTSLNGLFQNDTGLETVNAHGLATTSANSMGSMFQGDSNLATLDISGWDTKNVNNTSSMFQNCNSIKQIRLDQHEDKVLPLIPTDVFTPGRNLTIMVEGRTTANGGQYSFYSTSTPANAYQVNQPTWFKVAERGIRYGRPSDTGFFPPACVSWSNDPAATCTIAGSTGMTPPIVGQQLLNWKVDGGSTTYTPGANVTVPATFVTVTPQWGTRETLSAMPLTGADKHPALVAALLLAIALVMIAATFALRNRKLAHRSI
ncbi:BspA family leucine-rich repeat surface protein [Bifidobacterium sp. ESL0790]|uniref:BspA family leucine-rich repeat surface protein n=1 Tax=Bifidobacterium sp. ESL0790 TaxID=2983233 RepID=UPI0023F88EE0|nr:BspA family leucine-rich repeat surface protein [Bifidobacterium sp. ESL0790]WEV72314.1 BspA family leucine-rich repeat surface protein [Bifidobacterium sp. ESL0790]